MTGVRVRRGKFGHIDTHREEGHVNSEAEIGDAAVGKECQDYCNHQKLEEARKDTSLEPAEGAQTYRHLDFRLLASRTGKE